MREPQFPAPRRADAGRTHGQPSPELPVSPQTPPGSRVVAGRWQAGAFVALLAAVAVFAVAQPVTAATAIGGGEDPVARAAVVQLTGAHPAAVDIPARFDDEHGYRPVVRDGLLVDPLG